MRGADDRKIALIQNTPVMEHITKAAANADPKILLAVRQNRRKAYKMLCGEASGGTPLSGVVNELLWAAMTAWTSQQALLQREIEAKFSKAELYEIVRQCGCSESAVTDGVAVIQPECLPGGHEHCLGEYVKEYYWAAETSRRDFKKVFCSRSKFFAMILFSAGISIS